MTNFSTNAVAGPVIGSLVSKDKGDFSNRTKCAGSQLKNNVVTMLQLGAVGGAAVGTTKVISKSSKATLAVGKFFDKIVSKLPNCKFTDKLMKLPGKAKIAALVALPALLLVGYIRDKYIYKMGQIDQKYTDKVQIEEQTKKIYV